MNNTLHAVMKRHLAGLLLTSTFMGAVATAAPASAPPVSVPPASKGDASSADTSADNTATKALAAELAFAKPLHQQKPLTASLSVQNLNRILIFALDHKTLFMPQGPLCEYEYNNRRGQVTLVFDPSSKQLISTTSPGMGTVPVTYTAEYIGIGDERAVVTGSSVAFGPRRFAYEGGNAFSLTNKAGTKQVSVFAGDGLLRSATGSKANGAFGYNAVSTINEARTQMSLNVWRQRTPLTFEFGPRDQHGNPSYYAFVRGTQRQQFDLKYRYCGQ